MALEEYNNAIVEIGHLTTSSGTDVGSVVPISNTIGGDYYYSTYPTIWWGNYPVYVCTDKTAKAIDILKLLQAEKLIECRSVPKFIELVEKIARTL